MKSNHKKQRVIKVKRNRWALTSSPLDGSLPSCKHMKTTIVKVKVKVWTLAIVPLTWVRLVTSGALQSHKWQLTGMSQWCRSALCALTLHTLTDNWTHSAASRHTSPQSATPGLHPIAVATTHFPSHWGYEAELAWAHSRLATCSRLLAVDRVWVEPATSRIRVWYSTNCNCTHCFSVKHNTVSLYCIAPSLYWHCMV